LGKINSNIDEAKRSLHPEGTNGNGVERHDIDLENINTKISAKKSALLNKLNSDFDFIFKEIFSIKSTCYA